MSYKPEIYAIDFGTSNSLLSAANHSKVFHKVPLVKNGLKPEILRSLLYAPHAGEWYYGDDAIAEYLQQPGQGRVFKSLKRFLPDESFTSTRVFNEKLSLSDLLSKLLIVMRERANDFFQADVKDVVMGCPALFSDSEKAHTLALDRLKAACLSAGFQHVDFLPEPIAAAYSFHSQLKEEKIVLIADFGGGTSDFTVQKMSQKPFSEKDVLGIHGVSLAGDRYDGEIMKHDICPHLGTRAEFKKPTAMKPSPFPLSFIRMMCSPADLVMMSRQSALHKLDEIRQWVTDPKEGEKIDDLKVLIEDRMGYALFKNIEDAKVSLTQKEDALFAFSYVDIDIRERLSRESFEKNTQHLTLEILKHLDKCLELSGVGHDDIDIVCLTGGTSMLPSINRELRKRFGDRLETSSQFDSVVHGLAHRAMQVVQGDI